MATKKKKRPRRADTDKLLKESLVAALRRDASNEVKQTELLKSILVELKTSSDELSSIRILLEREATNRDLPALKKKPRRRKASK